MCVRVHLSEQKFRDADGKVSPDTDAKAITACKMIALLRSQVIVHACTQDTEPLQYTAFAHNLACVRE